MTGLAILRAIFARTTAAPQPAAEQPYSPIDFGLYHTFVARCVADGFMVRPKHPEQPAPPPSYLTYDLEDGRRVYVDPLIPLSAHRGIVNTVQAAEIPAELLQETIKI